MYQYGKTPLETMRDRIKNLENRVRKLEGIGISKVCKVCGIEPCQCGKLTPQVGELKRCRHCGQITREPEGACIVNINKSTQK